MTEFKDSPLQAAQTPLATSRRSFLQTAGASFALLAASPLAGAQQGQIGTDQQHAEGTFGWDIPIPEKKKAWENFSFSIDRWWGDFPKDQPDSMDMFADHPWAIGPFTKYASNPVLAPTPGGWDRGRFSGGVHNGSIIVKDNVFYYIYRGECANDHPKPSEGDVFNDIGIAISEDGMHFKKDNVHSPLFRKGEDAKYMYFDVNVVHYEDTYYLFCNQWLLNNAKDNRQNGMFLATSKDLLNWTKVGIIFPDAKRSHRNGAVLENPHNEAIKVNGNFVMYLDFGLIAYSKDLLHWESQENKNHIPGGECCFALGEYDAAKPDDIILFRSEQPRVGKE